MLAGYSPDAIYIHLVFVDIALLVGFYVAGMLIYYGLPEPSRAIVPNIIGFIHAHHDPRCTGRVKPNDIVTER